MNGYEMALIDAAIEWIRHDNTRGHTTNHQRLTHLEHCAQLLDNHNQRQQQNQP